MMPGIFVVFLLTAAVAGAKEPLIFDFESGALPEISSTADAWEVTPAEPGVATAADQTGRRPGHVCLTGDEARGGVFLKNQDKDDRLLSGEQEDFTVSLWVRADSVSASPVFFERLAGGSSQTAGLIRFRSQGNSGDEHGRKGTLRLYVRDADGEMKTATSTQSWQQDEGSWYQVAVVFTAGTVSFYLDGEMLGDPVDFGVAKIPGVAELAHHVRAGYGFKGAFDDLVVFPGRSLNDAQIQALYREGAKSLGRLK